MSRLSKSLCSAVLLPLFLLAVEVRVVDLSVRPRNPWNGKVDITYSLECSDSDASIQLSFQAYDNDRKQDVLMTALSGDGVGTALDVGGPYKSIWDSQVDYPDGHSSDLSIILTALAVEQPETLTGSYLVIDLSTGAHRSSSTAPSTSGDTCRTTELWLKRISAGTYTMGSPTTELGRLADEVQHQVTISQDYYIGVFEVTQKQYQLIMGSNPSQYTGNTRPVERVSYDDIRGNASALGTGWPALRHAVAENSFLGRLRAQTGLLFDLPTEGQWEHACRAGKTTALNTGKELASVSEDTFMASAGRYSHDTGDGKGGYSQHTKVGSYTANAWGLYDMHGNVAEWCLDCYDAYSTTAVTDPAGPAVGGYRVLRGGHWHSGDAQYCRSASRDYLFSAGKDNYAGFRVCLPAGPASN